MRSVNEIINYVLDAEDGEIGRCKDFLFDDLHFAVRYIVADTAKWLPGKKVLISPISIDEPDESDKKLPVHLKKSRIKQAPPLETHAPVSKQYEREFAQFYGYPFYWIGDGVWGPEYYASRLLGVSLNESQGQTDPTDRENHLRSVREVKGYHIEAADGDIGHVEDFLVESGSWVIRYVVVETRNLLPGGKKVLVSPKWAREIKWASEKFVLNMSTEDIKNSPAYEPGTSLVDKDYEAKLYDFYGKPHYWD